MKDGEGNGKSYVERFAPGRGRKNPKEVIAEEKEKQRSRRLKFETERQKRKEQATEQNNARPQLSEAQLKQNRVIVEGVIHNLRTATNVTIPLLTHLEKVANKIGDVYFLKVLSSMKESDKAQASFYKKLGTLIDARIKDYTREWS